MKEVDKAELFVILEAKQVSEKLTDQVVSKELGINRTSLHFMKQRKDGRTKNLEKIALLCKVKLKGVKKVKQRKEVENEYIEYSTKSSSAEEESAAKAERNAIKTEKRRELEEILCARKESISLENYVL